MSTLKVGTIQDHANSITAMTIDNAGRVLQPAKPAFSTTGTSYTQATGFSIVIPTNALINIGTVMNMSNGKFTAPIAGNYIFGFWGLSYNHSTEVNQIQNSKNGSGTEQA